MQYCADIISVEQKLNVAGRLRRECPILPMLFGLEPVIIGPHDWRQRRGARQGLAIPR